MIDGTSFIEKNPHATPGHPEDIAMDDPDTLRAQLVSLQGLNAALGARVAELELERGTLAQDKQDLLEEVMRLAPLEDAHNDAKAELDIAQAETRINADEVERLKVDGVTGLLTRGSWESSTLGQMMRRRRSTDTSPCFVALGDLDHFKGVNDTFGHLFGDAVLKAAGDAAKEVLGEDAAREDRRRDKPLAGRFGGEELVFWLPAMNRADAELVAKRFQAAVNEIGFLGTDTKGRPVESLNGRLTQGVSIGLAEVNIDSLDPSKSLHDALRQADEALYDVKQSGRNGIRVYTPAAVIER